MQGTLYSWTKEMEPAQANSFGSLLSGVAEGATADALRFFDMDKSYIIRVLRCAVCMNAGAAQGAYDARMYV